LNREGAKNAKVSMEFVLLAFFASLRFHRPELLRSFANSVTVLILCGTQGVDA